MAQDLHPLLTRWGKAMPACPLPEYPRPQLRRENWQNLNGTWRYAIRQDTAHPESWDGDILVPYSPESLLSGVCRQLLPGQTLWYRRSVVFSLPGGGERLLLHFGAVDQKCTVYLNGKKLGIHTGGYWPFAFDITEAARPGENTLEVMVTDDSDTGCEAYGKQKLNRGEIWYTATSGIWQTVWCEIVPRQYIEALRITPLYGQAAVEVVLTPALAGTLRVLAEGTVVAEAVFEDGTTRIPLPGFKSWTPDEPFLYTLEITAGADRVTSYFGMREFGITKAADGLPRLTLNGKPLLHNGLLDQGYWSDGMYTPPSDEAMVWELETVKALGFNMLRKHIKIEPLRWYYHCDRLGILVWQDFVSAGGPYNPLIIKYAPWLGIHFGDGERNYPLHGMGNPATRAAFLRDAKRTLRLLYNTVSLAVWVPFNEGWGQFDAAEMARLVRNEDATRHIDHASGYFDQGAGDFNSYHVYYKRFRPKKGKPHRVLALTEFGGYSLPVEGHMAARRPYGYKMFADGPSLGRALAQLYAADVQPYIARGLGAIIYTQVSDVEDEINGLLTFDRAILKVDAEHLRQLNQRLYESFAESL